MISSCPLPSKKTSKPDPNVNDYAVGDRIKVNMHRGRIVEAVVKAVVDYGDGKRLQVDFGRDETADSFVAGGREDSLTGGYITP